jgi:HEAT repeat protein
VAAAAAAALGRIAAPPAVEALTRALGGPESLRPAVGDACLTAADVLLAEDKRAEAVALFDAMRKADLPKHLQIAALAGAISARGSAGAPLLVEQLQSLDKGFFRVALSMAQKVPGKEVTEALVAEIAKLPTTSEAPPKVLTITKAEYGARNKWVDVTGKLADAVSNNGLSVEASNGLAGDPINGVAKKLRITYTLDGQEAKAEIPEGESFEINSDTPQHPRQALLMFALGQRGDRSALPVVLEAAKSGPWDVRVSAVRVLAKLGDAGAVPVLLETAAEAQGELGSAARDSLADLPGREVDATLEAMLANSEGRKRLAVVELIGRRGIASAVPELEKLADGDNAQLSAASVGALGLTVGLDELPALIGRLLEAKTPEVGSTVKEALRKACLRMPDRDACATILIDHMSRASTASKGDLMDLLGVVGGARALDGVSSAAREGSEAVQDAATRVLGGWMNADAAPVLLELAKTGPEQFRIRCLRGYVRIPRQLDVPLDQRISMCRKALAVAERDDERKLAFEVLARYPSAGSLAAAVPYLESPTLKEAAAATAVAIAEKIFRNEPAAVVEPMRKTFQATGNEELADRARRLMRQAEKRSEK